MPSSITYEYLSCAVQRTAHVADWVQWGEGRDALVLGVHKAVAVWLDPSEPAARAPAVHMWPLPCQETVHVLKAWPDHVTRIVVGTYEGGLELWRVHEDELCCDASVLGAHAAAITAVGVPRDAYTREHGPREFVTGGSDSKLRVWSCDPLRVVQTIDLEGAFPLDVALVKLPQTDAMVMAVAATDRRISLYVRSGGAGTYVRQLRLAGHEDWVRALDFTVALPDVWLASASQDQHVRLWRWRPETRQPQAPTDAFEAMARELLPDEGIRTKIDWLSLPGSATRWGVSLDALLLGHDAWVTGVRWCPSVHTEPLAALLTSSVDHSVIVWTPDAATSSWPTLQDAGAAVGSLWLPAHRLGDVGSSSGGFLGAHWRPHRDLCVVAHDRQGAMHMWRRTATHKWEPQATISGHAGPARDAAWERYGDCFLTVGQDRTTRLHGTVHTARAGRTWHELARPQTHGYEMQSVAWLGRTSFVSAADEKILRVFAAPKAFVHSATAWHMWQTPTPQPRHVLVLSQAAASAGDMIESVMCETHYTNLAVVAWLGDMSMRGAEHVLQRVYACAWDAAVQADCLGADVTVYLLPDTPDTERGVSHLRAWAAHHAPLASLYADDGVPRTALDVMPLEPKVMPLRAAAAEAVEPASVQGDSVVLGGTFDHLHIGHKLLLTMGVLSARSAMWVGVTSTALLAKKEHREYIEPIDVRMARVRQFLRDVSQALGKSLALHVVPISDPCGPAGTLPDLDVLLVTEETVRGIEPIAAERAKHGVRPLHVYTVSLVHSAAAAKTGSTDIRAWLARRQQTPGTDWSPTVHEPATDGLASAHVPPLGLSNRAVEGASEVAAFTKPPNPEQLQSLTLWPEMEKLYGHGYELLSVAMDTNTHMIASTCKASTPAHAVVRLFDAQHRFEPAKDALEGHTLSITRVAFSPCGTYLLTVSRDRSWRMFRRTPSGYVAWIGERAHARIVWDGAWAPHSRMFATASRDKSVKIWTLVDDAQRPYRLVTTLNASDAVVSVTWASDGALAMGLENGDVWLYTCARDGTWQLHTTLARHHTGPVHRVACRPQGRWMDAYDRVPYQLLSVGDDGCTRLVSWYIDP